MNPYLFSIIKPKQQQVYIREHGDHSEKAKRIVQCISDNFNISRYDLASASRKQEIVIARQIAMYALREFTNLRLKQIGDMFGGRDHTTVIYAIETVNDRKDTDKFYAHILQKALNSIT